MGKLIRRYSLIFISLLLATTCTVAMAVERYVWAAQGDVALFTENGKVGLQTVQGAVLHEAAFDQVSYFDDMGQAAVFVDGKIGRMDRAGNMVVEPLLCDELERLGSGAEQVLIFRVGEHHSPTAKAAWGFLSLTGELLSEAKWDHINAFENGFAYVDMDGTNYAIDVQGNIIQEEEFPGWVRSSMFGDYTDSDSARMMFNPSGERIAIIDIFPDKSGHGIYTLGAKIYLNGQVYKRDDWSHFRWLSEDRYAFQQNGKWGIVDQDMNEIWPARWDYIFNDHTPALYWNYSWESHTPKGIWLVCDDPYYGWMDETGKMVLESIYVNIAPVGENLWLAGTNDLSGNPQGDHLILNEKGEIVRTIPESVGTAVSYGEGYISYYQNESGDWGLMNIKGEILSHFGGDVDNFSTVSDGRIRIWRMGSEGEELGFSDVYGNIISSPDWKEVSDFSHGYAVVDTAKGLRYIDHKGKIVGGEEWDFISDYFFTGSQ